VVNGVLTGVFNFNVRDHDDSFVTDWIAHMFKSADVIAQVKYDNYVKDKGFADELAKLTPKQREYVVNQLRREVSDVSIIGFNSAIEYELVHQIA